MRDVIRAAYCTHLQDAAQKQRQSPDDELPFWPTIPNQDGAFGPVL
jgi:hypothetical protein